MATTKQPDGVTPPSRTRLPEELVERWPVPDEMLPSFWDAMTYAERERWLFEFTYERSGDDWVLRDDHRDATTSRQVEQAITTVRGADAALGPIAEQAYEDLDVDHPLAVKQWTVVALAVILIFLVIIGALLSDLFGGGDDGATETTTPPTASVQTGPVPDTRSETADDGDAVGQATPTSPETSAAPSGPTDTITFSSVPGHATYARTWSDGEIVLQLGPDGRYLFRSADVDTDGEFRITTEDGVDRLLFVDPDDSSGLTVLSAVPISLDGDELVYGEGDGALRLAEVDELP